MNNKAQVKQLRFYLCFLIILLYLCILTPIPAYGLAQPINLATIEGQVIEDPTGDPIENATVAVWTEGGILKSSNKTDSNGYYKIEIEGGFKCRVYAYYDDQSTPGFDYVPAFRSFYLQKEAEVNITFRLVPAASIILEGDILFVESTKPPFRIDFTVIDPNSGSPLSGNDRVYVYGTDLTSHTHFLGLNSSHVVIPADVAVNIKVNSTVLVADKWAYRAFIIDDAEPLNLSKGRLVHVGVRKYSLQFNLDLVKDLVRDVGESLNETEQKGFYIIVERHDLATIDKLIEKAEEELTQELYEECYADLREAYIGVVSLNKRLGTMHAEASISTIILIIFLAFTAMALAYLFLERKSQKALATCILYAVLLLVLHRTYPGCMIVNATLFFKTAVTSLGIAFSFVFILPYFIKEQAVEGRIAFRSAVTAVFSMAKRNLQRRKLRFTLTLITVTVLVMSFVALTSFSMGYGLIAKPLDTATPPSEGLLVMQPLPSLSLMSSSPVIETFTPLDPSDVNWIQGKPEIMWVAPKAENIPTDLPLGTIALPKTAQSIQLFGVLGILPNAEARITHIDSIIVAGKGRYLRDKEENAVLISASAAEKLNAAIGDRLLLNDIEVELVGIFDDGLFNQLIDLNGEPITPRKVVLIDPGGEGMPPTYRVVPCDPSEIIITTWQAALDLPILVPWLRVSLSRIDVQVKDAESILPLARRVALERDYWVWTATGGQVYLTCLKSYFEAKGLPILVPWLIVILNVVTTMLNAIFERRREIAILSSIGLNPSHITALFVAEATIIGVIGGGVGYLSGLGLYRLMSTLSITLEVRQKVSAAWCLGALGIAATAVVIGAIVAIRSSVIITPSLLRRWKVEEKPSTPEEPWVFTMPIPIEVRQRDINSFIDYVRSHLEYEGEADVRRIERVRQIEEEAPEAITKRIKFNYYFGGTYGLTINELVATKGKEEEVYTIKLISKGDEDPVYKTASFIRMLLLKWSAIRK